MSNQFKGFNTNWLSDRGLSTISLALLEQAGARAKTEAELQSILLKWIRVKYPEAYRWTHVDLSGVRLGFKARATLSDNGLSSGFPDIVIYLPSGGFNGLALELKRDGERPIKKDGTISADKHVQDQSLWINQFRACNFSANFVTGFKNAATAVDEYLTGSTENKGATPQGTGDGSLAGQIP